MSSRHDSRRAFTLTELLVTIGIISILAAVVLVILNPSELLKQSRDARRVSDIATLNGAISYYYTDQQDSPSFSMGTSSVTYISAYDPSAASASGTDCSGIGFVAGGYFQCGASSTYRDVDGTGWIPVNFQSVASGAPFGALPIDPTNQTSTGLYYSYQPLNGSFRLLANPESQKYLAQAATLPTNPFAGGTSPSMYGTWVPVPGNSTFGTGNFYVMKYEASCMNLASGQSLTSPLSGNGYQDNNSSSTYCVPANGLGAVSLPNANPIVLITRASSSIACAAIGAHLITNNEWQTAAWNIESNPINWSASGTIYSGHNDGSPNNLLLASADDSQGYYGDTNVGGSQKRTLTLTDGAIVWDMAGNIYEWTNDTITGANEPNTGNPIFAWYEYTAITSWGTLTQQTTAAMNPAWNSGQGIGKINSSKNGSATVYAFARGGSWTVSTAAGIESLHLHTQDGTSSNNIGFRCVR